MTKEKFDRRDFFKGASSAAVTILLADDLLLGREVSSSTIQTTAISPPVKIGVIGLGQWGKEIVSALSRIPSAEVVGICDTYEPYIKKAQEIAPKATSFTDYRKLLEAPGLEAVVIATPSYIHKEIAIVSIDAGKHVYCEAPIASSIEDAKAIVLAAQKSNKLIFQTGLQGRSNELYQHISKFVKTGILGNPTQVTAQWNKKLSWKRMAPTPEREKELNWRLSNKTSTGLLGEVGIHQIDLINWFMRGLPVSATGFGSILNWKDDRDVSDTVQCILEYPNNLRAILSLTLTSSFSDSFTLFQGSNSSLMMREKKGWLIKEADSPLLGWEVYAQKEPVNNETGIVMVANSTKLLEAGKEPSKDGSLELNKDPLFSALESFSLNVRTGSVPASGALEGYQATVAAIKGNEAILAGSKVTISNDLYTVKS
jgi:predicted dehydrogenase